jgi:2-keto-4-pentenoate hydratase
MSTSSQNSLQDPRIAAGMRAQCALKQRYLQEGAKQIGWKVGFGAPAAKEKLKIAMPVIGFLLDRALVSSGARVSIAGWRKPVAEPEIAVHLGRDLPANSDISSVRAAVAAIGPAIELADIDRGMDDLEGILAGDIFQRHVILGPRDASRAGAVLDGLRGRVVRGGKDVPVPPALEDNTGEILSIVQHVANVTAAMGEGVYAGQFIICGSVTAPIFLEPGDTDIEWTLDPVGAVSVAFAPA